MGQLKGTETPKQVAAELIGDSDNVMSQNLRNLVIDAIKADRAAREVKRPTGLPFDVVSDAAADVALAFFVRETDDPTMGGERPFKNHEAEKAYSDEAIAAENSIRAVIDHRAHLNKQVTNEQTNATAVLLDKRAAQSKLRGVMSWIVGDDRAANPYDATSDEACWQEWNEGWAMAYAAYFDTRKGKR